MEATTLLCLSASQLHQTVLPPFIYDKIFWCCGAFFFSRDLRPGKRFAILDAHLDISFYLLAIYSYNFFSLGAPCEAHPFSFENPIPNQRLVLEIHTFETKIKYCDAESQYHKNRIDCMKR